MRGRREGAGVVVTEPVTDVIALANIAVDAVRAANPAACCLVIVIHEDPKSNVRGVGARGVSKRDAIQEFVDAGKFLLEDEAARERAG